LPRRAHRRGESESVPPPVLAPNPVREKTGKPAIESALDDLKHALDPSTSNLWIDLLAFVTIALLVAAVIAGFGVEAVVASIVFVLGFAMSLISSGAASASTVLKVFSARRHRGLKTDATLTQSKE
jgi:hypothetical protein